MCLYCLHVVIVIFDIFPLVVAVIKASSSPSSHATVKIFNFALTNGNAVGCNMMITNKSENNNNNNVEKLNLNEYNKKTVNTHL